MLVSYTVAGFKSFKRPTVFDFKKTQYQVFEGTNTENGVLKGGLFVGGNASGKTNAVEAINILLTLLFSSDSRPNFDKILCLFSPSGVMDLHYSFLIDGHNVDYQIRYQKQDTLLMEQLSVDGELMLERIGSHATSKISERREFDQIPATSVFLRNLWFNTQFQGNEILQKWFSYMENSIYFNLLLNRGFVTKEEYKPFVYIDEYLRESGPDEINQFLRECNFSYQVSYYPEQIFNQRSRYSGVYLNRDGISVEIPMAYESTGNQVLMTLLPPIFYVIKHGGMLIIDEFSSGLHNDLERLLVRYFMKHSHNAQLFLVSHSTNLISSGLFRPDQIYAVNFDKEGSNIVRFSSRQPRVGQNFEKMYLSGMFSGVPHYHEV